ncbi:MAG: hypothetical protein JW751_27210 [Polyangiaceae bacterium]|nr:hypothetical protein [Polyangiaceae bacterium]
MAATATGAVVFSGGTVTTRRTLPLDYLTAVAVSDSGDLVVGGVDATGNGVLLCEGPPGSVGWSAQLGLDRNAYRPHVAVARRSGGFYAITREGLTSHSVTRRFP